MTPRGQRAEIHRFSPRRRPLWAEALLDILTGAFAHPVRRRGISQQANHRVRPLRSGLPDLTKRPVSPSLMMSRSASIRDAITGLPAAMASVATKPKVSALDGTTQTLA